MWVQTLMARLKTKRFRQIFDYLDQEHEGVIDLLNLTTGMHCLTSHLGMPFSHPPPPPPPLGPWALPAMAACCNVENNFHNDSINSINTRNI